MINASQYSFDFEVLGTYTGSSAIEDIVVDLLNELGYYVLGCMCDADEIDWSTGYDSDMDYSKLHQCGVDYFRTPDAIRDFEPLLEQRLAEVGCQFWASDSESVEYDNDIVKDVASWYDEPVEQVVDNLISAGYIDEYDRDDYLEG